MQRIEAIITRATGLDVSSVGPSFIRRAVNSRMRATGFSRLADYQSLILRRPAELQALIEESVVPETWFFRDPNAFAILAQIIVDEWLPTHAVGKVRILSIPCSTGEEPYSIVIALKEAGVPENRFAIDAVDISGNGLRQARAGTYRRNAFRSGNLSFRTRHFKSLGKAWTINESIRRKVAFLQGNLLDAKFIRRLGTYDFIFCRNLLIYLDEEARVSAACQLHRMLKKSGQCYFSAAEISMVLGSGFEQTGLRMAFACRKDLLPRSIPIESELLSHSNNKFRATTRRRPPQKMNNPLASGADFAGDLPTVSKLAGAGNWKEAMPLCERHLRHNALCADGHFLLGQLRQMSGDGPKAAASYRHALFLQPDHYESIVRLADLAQRAGNPDQARVLTERAAHIRISLLRSNASL